MSLFTSMDAAKKNSGARRRDQDTIEKRARQALRMVHLGEVSAGRQTIAGAALACGDNTTLSQLRDQSRRRALPREALPDFVSSPNRILFGRKAGSLTTFGKPDGARHQALLA